jgi:hypothetical protein
MVKFDELRISEDGRFLTVECHVENYDMYREMYIESIYLEYYKNRGAAGLSDKALLLFENHNTTPSDVRGVRKCISVDDLPSWFDCGGFEGGLFYVYVTCNGNPTPAHLAEMERNCTFDNAKDIGVIVDWKMLYRMIMPLVAQYASSCTPCEDITGFGHMILMWYAFKYAVETCDWTTVDRLWGEFAGDTVGTVSRGGCGCGA